MRFIYIMFALFALIFQCKNQQKNLSLTQKWKKASRLDTLQQTVEQFPFLIQNIKIKKLVELIDLGICQFMQGDPGRYIIVDNQVYLYGGQKHYQRVQHYQKYLQKILKIYKVPDMYLLVHIYDGLFPTLVKEQAIERCRSIPMFLFNKNLSQYITSTKFLLPDNYITIDKWPQMIKEIKNISHQYQWKNKISKLFYRGACVGPFWHDHKIIPQPITRQIVLKYCQRCGYAVLSYQHPDMVDAKLTTKCLPDLKLTKFIVEKYGQSNLYGDFLQFTRQGKYRYLLYADGAANSWRRAASFLFSSSVLFMPFSQNVQWFYRYMIPDVNFVMINNDLSDLLDKMQQLQKNQTKAQQIVKMANILAQKHLTFEAMANYTIQQITKYADIQKLQLRQEEKADLKRGVDAQLVLKLKLMRQQWEELNQYVAIEKILKNFPQIQQNIQISRLIDMQDSCKKSLAKFLISNNQIYCQGEYCQNLNSKRILSLMKKILKKEIISDCYFLINVDQQISQKNSANNSQTCKDLPYFVFTKNQQSQQQLNKFLFPHPQFQSWQDQVNQFFDNVNKKDWDLKENKTFFGGMIDQSLPQKKQKFIKQLIGVINSKKQYFQDDILKNFQAKKEADFNINERYKYLLLKDGVNTKYRKLQILAMLSKMMVLSPKFKKISWIDDIIISGKHYIQIKEDLSNLKYTIQLLIENDEKVRELCEEAFILASIELKNNSIDKYIIRVLNSYSTVQKLNLSEDQKQKLVQGILINQVLKTQKQYRHRYQIFFSVIIFFVLAFYACLKIFQEYLQTNKVSSIQQELQQRGVFKQFRS